MTLKTDLAGQFSDLAEVIHLFFPDDSVTLCEDADVCHTRRLLPGGVCDTFCGFGQTLSWSVSVHGDGWEQKRRIKRGVKHGLYLFLSQVTGIRPAWGSLTGIRPTRLVWARLEAEMTLMEAEKSLSQVYDVRADRAKLAAATVARQRQLPMAGDHEVDVYLSIPFCPTRCTYCSFFACAIGNGKRVAPYLTALFHEMQAMGDWLRKHQKTVRCLYIGGGTPTSLRKNQLDALLSRVSDHFPNAMEVTVEAGRPDTLDDARLSVLQQYGITRISINPQTMQDKTLQAIGRAHTAEDTLDAFQRARAYGMAHINMDVIAGLPGETFADFVDTIRRIESLSPEALSVHTLARKHGSRLNEQGYQPVDAPTMEAMLDYARERAEAMGMSPYYLYRQKYCPGHLENVSYAKPGHECLYNVDMMEETATVMGVGAGAVTKRFTREQNLITRQNNPGDIGHYTTRIEATIQAKVALLEAP